MLKLVHGRSKMKLSTKVINGLKAVNLKAHKKNVSIIFQKKKEKITNKKQFAKLQLALLRVKPNQLSGSFYVLPLRHCLTDSQMSY